MKAACLLWEMHLRGMGFVALKTRSIAVIALIALFAAAISAVSVAEQGAKEPPQTAKADARVARKATLGGVPNFGVVTPTLYRGAHPTEAGFEKLAELGIQVVVDVRGGPSEDERKQLAKLGMQYVSIPWRCFHPQDRRIAQFLKLVQESRGKKIFVHCRLGDDRTGLMIATYRMAEQGWTAEEALKEMEAYGFNWFHHYLICPGLASYEANFPQRFKKSSAFQDVRRHAPATKTAP
jgi:tyrosine-protein phosphatase SIW14